MEPATSLVFSTVELLEKILVYLPLRELCRSQMVCCHWRDVVRSSLSLQRNAFLASAFTSVARPSPLHHEHHVDLAEYSAEGMGATAVNPLVHAIFDTDSFDRSDIRIDEYNRDVFMDIQMAISDSHQLRENMKAVLGVDVENLGWNENIRETSWHRMLLVDPPGKGAILAWGCEEEPNWATTWEWLSPALRMGELIDHVVMHCLEDGDEDSDGNMDEACRDSVSVSKNPTVDNHLYVHDGLEEERKRPTVRRLRGI